LKAILIVLLVVGFLGGALLTLLRSRNAGMPDKEVLKRAAERERSLSKSDQD
jgi:hypothetical protein